MIVKSTTLEGYYATGDGESFCFDRHEDPIVHRKIVGYEDDCRTYPTDLLPEGSYHKRGRWTITVEFEPYEDPSN